MKNLKLLWDQFSLGWICFYSLILLFHNLSCDVSCENNILWGTVSRWMGSSVICSSKGTACAMTLEESIQLALSESDRIREIRADREKAFAEARQVDTFTATRIDTALSYNELGTSAEDSLFYTYPDREATTNVTISRLLWAGGRIPVSHALKQSLMTLADLGEQSMTRDLIREVSTAFHTVLYQQARLDVMKDRVRQRKDELGDASDLFDAGMVTNLDVREAKLNLHMAQDELRAGENDYHTALVDFNLTLGRAPDIGSGDLAPSIPGSQSGNSRNLNGVTHPAITHHVITPQGTLQRAKGAQASLKAIESLYHDGAQLDIRYAESGLDNSENRLKMAKGERLPEIALVAGGAYGGENASELETSWNVGARLSWNILDGGAKEAAIDAARAERVQCRTQLAQVRQRLAGVVDKLKSETISLERRIALQEESVNLSNGNYEDARGMYGTGTMTLTRLGDFNLLYAEARFNLLRLYYLENLIAVEIDALLYDEREVGITH